MFPFGSVMATRASRMRYAHAATLESFTRFLSIMTASLSVNPKPKDFSWGLPKSTKGPSQKVLCLGCIWTRDFHALCSPLLLGTGARSICNWPSSASSCGCRNTRNRTSSPVLEYDCFNSIVPRKMRLKKTVVETKNSENPATRPRK